MFATNSPAGVYAKVFDNHRETKGLRGENLEVGGACSIFLTSLKRPLAPMPFDPVGLLLASLSFGGSEMTWIPKVVENLRDAGSMSLNIYHETCGHILWTAAVPGELPEVPVPDHTVSFSRVPVDTDAILVFLWKMRYFWWIVDKKLGNESSHMRIHVGSTYATKGLTEEITWNRQGSVGKPVELDDDVDRLQDDFATWASLQKPAMGMKSQFFRGVVNPVWLAAHEEDRSKRLRLIDAIQSSPWREEMLLREERIQG
jgi:hypothetical protein